MKYVIVDYLGIETPIIFEEIVDHCSFYERFNIVSAGFVKIYGTEKPIPNACCCENAMKVSVWGESTTLKLKSRPEDEKIILDSIHRHYK